MEIKNYEIECNGPIAREREAEAKPKHDKNK